MTQKIHGENPEDENPWSKDPAGIDFFDQASGRSMRLVLEGRLRGWIIYWHKHSKNWVTLRESTQEDRDVISEADSLDSGLYDLFHTLLAPPEESAP